MPKILKSSQIIFDSSDKINIDITPLGSNERNRQDDLSEAFVEEQAETLIESARRQAAEIIAEARRIADETYSELDESVRKTMDEASEQGKASGYMEGYNEGMSQTEELRQKAKLAYDNALEEREKLLKNVEPELINLIVRILKKIISSEIEINPSVILYLIRKGLDSSTASGQYKLLVSPEDYVTVSSELKELSSLLDASSKLDVIRDQSLNKSDCIIETPFGNIDCGLSQQYNSLKSNLYYILNNSVEDEER